MLQVVALEKNEAMERFRRGLEGGGEIEVEEEGCKEGNRKARIRVGDGIEERGEVD